MLCLNPFHPITATILSTMNHSFYSFLLGSHMITLLISQTLMNNYNHNSYKVIIMIIIIHKDSCLQSFTIKILDLPAPPNNHISSHLLTNPFQLLCFRFRNCLVDVWCILMTLTSIQNFATPCGEVRWNPVLRWASSGYIKRQPSNHKS